MATTIAGLALSAVTGVGLSWLAHVLNKPQGQKPVLDKTKTPLASRGSWLPLVLGRSQRSFTFAWAGKRRTQTETTGGKGVGSDEGVETIKYLEGGWHLLCVGPITRLVAVKKSARVIWPHGGGGPTDATTDPSGSVLTAKGVQGKFAIYWGEKDQPINTHLATPDRVGIASAWPNVGYVEWMPKMLGGQPVWPPLEYDYVVGPHASLPTLNESAAWLDDGTSEGWNAAHAMWRLITAPYPHGMGLPASDQHVDAFEALGELCETEHHAINVDAEDGETAANLLGRILEDLGATLPQVRDSLKPRAIRPEAGPWLTLTSDLSLEAEPEVEQRHGDFEPDRLSFIIRDDTMNFKPYDLNVPVDPGPRARLKVQPKQIEMSTITNRSVGLSVVKRRQQMELAEATVYTVQGHRDCRLLEPGQSFEYTGVGIMRVASIRRSWPNPGVEVRCLLDQYSRTPGTYTPTPGGSGAGDTTQLLPDPWVRVIDVPDSVMPGVIAVVLRMRANDASVGSYIWFSADDVNFVRMGEQNTPCAGGTTLFAVGATDGVVDGSGAKVIAVGPRINPPSVNNTDFELVQDLSGNDAAWRSGEQCMLLDQEVFYVKRFVVQTDGSWEPRDMIRGGWGSAHAAHAAGEETYVFSPRNLTPFSGGPIVGGGVVHVKSQPYSAGDAVDLASIPSVSGTMAAWTIVLDGGEVA